MSAVRQFAGEPLEMDRVMCLEAAAKHLKQLGYPANANQLWRMCRSGKLKHSVYRKRLYVTHAQLMAALHPVESAGSVKEVSGPRMPHSLRHQRAMAQVKKAGLMPSEEAVQAARARAAELEAAVQRGDGLP